MLLFYVVKIMKLIARHRLAGSGRQPRLAAPMVCSILKRLDYVKILRKEIRNEVNLANRCRGWLKTSPGPGVC